MRESLSVVARERVGADVTGADFRSFVRGAVVHDDQFDVVVLPCIDDAADAAVDRLRHVPGGDEDRESRLAHICAHPDMRLILPRH